MIVKEQIEKIETVGLTPVVILWSSLKIPKEDGCTLKEVEGLPIPNVLG